MKPTLIHTRNFPPSPYLAITIFPFVFYNDTLSESDIRHETVHLWQQAGLLVIPFYLLYLLFWMVNLLRYRDTNRAYREIPFERSAYRLDKTKHLRRSTMAFDWISCIGNRPTKNKRNNG